MKRIFCFFLFASLLLTSPSYGDAFISGFDDIPLMDGLRQISDQDFYFGNEESDYTETLLKMSNKKSFSDIKLYYKKVLPSFGWLLVNETENILTFSREQDVLEFSSSASRPTNILISLKRKN